MLEHTSRLHTRKTIYLKFVTFYMHILRLYRLMRDILSCQILFFFHVKMMTWSHRNVVPNSFRLLLSQLYLV